MKEEIKLKPCPFCGDEVVYVPETRHDHAYIMCVDCGYCLETMNHALVSVWNDRRKKEDMWQPIETAPRDGFFLVYEDGAMRAMFRHNGEFQSPAYAAIDGEYGENIVGDDAKRLTGGRLLKVCDIIREPTHWMPLPPFEGEKK